MGDMIHMNKQAFFNKLFTNGISYENYVTGMALASALSRGDIQVAYICLVPAINAYANAKIPIKIIAGTHKHGYGLVVNPEKIKEIRDLESSDIRIGCVREGGAVDVLLHKTIDKYNLDEKKLLPHLQRMDPAKQLLAIKMGQLDAAFLPEQWATMAEEFGFKMLLTSEDIWPDMQGSVLVVKQELIKSYPDTVRKLVEISRRATDWIKYNPEEAASIMARQLQVISETLFTHNKIENTGSLDITPQVLFRSMERLDYSTDINQEIVQETIDYLVKLGYIKSSFDAENILDLGFLKNE